MLYNIDEITLIPNFVSTIKSRSDCNPLYENKYPIFVSPMSCLVDNDNYVELENLGLNVIIPRTVDWRTRIYRLESGDNWVAVGLKEAKYIYDKYQKIVNKGDKLKYVPHLCIDQANGHMEELLFLCKNFKYLLGRDGIQIMTGNIANPDTYYTYALHGVDYVRCAVGTGHGCTTSCQTGFNYPMGSLLIDINKQKEQVKRDLVCSVTNINNCIYTLPKVIADGGIGTSEQVIKALALGADYVMLGEIIARSDEACGKPIPSCIDMGPYKNEIRQYSRSYYGMSTKRAQEEINNASYEPNPDFKPKRAEGIEKIVPIEYSMKDWLNDFQTDLKSAMSYANAKDLEHFIGKVKWDTISIDSRMKFMGKLQK